MSRGARIAECVAQLHKMTEATVLASEGATERAIEEDGPDALAMRQAHAALGIALANVNAAGALLEVAARSQA